MTTGLLCVFAFAAFMAIWIVLGERKHRAAKAATQSPTDIVVDMLCQQMLIDFDKIALAREEVTRGPTYSLQHKTLVLHIEPRDLRVVLKRNGVLITVTHPQRERLRAALRKALKHKTAIDDAKDKHANELRACDAIADLMGVPQ